MQSSSLNPVRPTDESLSRLAGLFLQILLPLSGNIRLGEADFDADSGIYSLSGCCT
jgi:hypothetical protein